MFSFKSADEREREQEEYFRKIFPLGIEQKEAMVAMLNSLVAKKRDQSELLFMFIISKQEYLDKNKDAFPKIIKRLKKARIFSKEEIKFLLAFVMMESKIPSLEAYPTKEEIILKADSISI